MKFFVSPFYLPMIITLANDPWVSRFVGHFKQSLVNLHGWAFTRHIVVERFDSS